MVILGESGCGKSTLLKLCYGLLDSSSGSIVFDGEKVTGPLENLLPGHPAMSLVYQDYRLMPKVSIWENLLYPLKDQTKDYREAMAEELLNMFKLQEHLHKLPYQLSGGQQQRVAFARALSTKPRLLLMDEPLSNLDTMLKDDLRNELREILGALGTSLILVSHDVEDAYLLADKLVIMREGKILQAGKPEEIYRKPVNKYAGELTGRLSIIPDNLLPDNFKNKLCGIRPENISLTTEPSAFKATLVDKQFYGSYCLIKLKTAGDFLLEAVCKPHQILTNSGVFFSFDPADIIVFSN